MSNPPGHPVHAVGFVWTGIFASPTDTVTTNKRHQTLLLATISVSKGPSVQASTPPTHRTHTEHTPALEFFQP